MADTKTAVRKWMAFSMRAAAVLLMGLLFIFYFTLLLPLGLIYRLVADPLRLKSPQGPGSLFTPRRRTIETPESARNPF